MKHKSLEMKYLVSCVALNLLILANLGSTQLTDITHYEYNVTDPVSGQRIQFYDIRASIHLACNVTDDLGKFEWRKDGTPIHEIGSLKSRSSFYPKGKLHIKETSAADVGNYSCVLLDSQDNLRDSISFIVSAKPAIKVPGNINVVEGEKLIIVCTVLGNPMPIVTWKIGEGGNRSLNMSDERIKITNDPETKVNNTVLSIEDIQLSDRDVYTCTARSPYSDNVFKVKTTQIRVKDKLAALWPFLGICAEVFVLCAIILIYEKKRNKTELEESDTDQSPDQKNTPDHGKDSDVRHRK